MNQQLAVREKDNLRASIRILKFFVIVVGIALIYLGIMVYNAVTYQKTICVPFGLDRKLVVSGDDISDEGMEDYARLVTTLRANYHPGTARKQFTRLLVLYAPDSYPEAWKTYYDFADRIETTNVSSVYYFDKFEIDRSDKRLIVDGFNRKYKDNTPLSESGIRFLISYKIDHGMFQVVSIEEKEKK